MVDRTTLIMKIFLRIKRTCQKPCGTFAILLFREYLNILLQIVLLFLFRFILSTAHGNVKEKRKRDCHAQSQSCYNQFRYADS